MLCHSFWKKTIDVQQTILLTSSATTGEYRGCIHIAHNWLDLTYQNTQNLTSGLTTGYKICPIPYNHLINCSSKLKFKILQIQKVAFDLRYETSGRLLSMPSTTSHSSYHISTDLWLAWHFSRTQFDVTNQKAVAHISPSSLVMDNGLLIDVELHLWEVPGKP